MRKNLLISTVLTDEWHDDLLNLNFLLDDLRMSSVPFPDHNSIESVLLVGGIFNNTSRTIGFLQRIFPLDGVTVTRFLLRFNITGMMVFYGVVKLIFGRSLCDIKKTIYPVSSFKVLDDLRIPPLVRRV